MGTKQTMTLQDAVMLLECHENGIIHVLNIGVGIHANIRVGIHANIRARIRAHIHVPEHVGT